MLDLESQLRRYGEILNSSAPNPELVAPSRSRHHKHRPAFMVAALTAAALFVGGLAVARQHTTAVIDVGAATTGPTPTRPPQPTAPGVSGGHADGLVEHTSPDGHFKVSAQIQPACPTSADPPPCPSSPSGQLLIVELFLDGVSHGKGGGANESTPQSTPMRVIGGSAPGVCQPDTPACDPNAIGTTVNIQTRSDVANVTIDLRQSDGRVVTDEMRPEQGLVIFAAAHRADFQSPARAYDEHGSLLGLVDNWPWK